MDGLYDLAIVGAGLSTTSFLRAGGAGNKRTIVLDYQQGPGGWLRHALPAPGFDHAADLIHSFKPPSSVEMCCGVTAVRLLAPPDRDAPVLMVRTGEGREQIHARRVLLACGGFEETRQHAQIPGTRPAGVCTPIFVHQMLARGYLPGHRAVVCGASRYATATAGRMAAAGIEVMLVPPHGTSVPAVDGGVRVEEPAALVGVQGLPRVERIELLRDGKRSSLAADTLVYAAGMIANTYWLAGSGVELGSDGAVVVTDRFETSVPGVYAMGTVVAPSLDHVESIAMGERAAQAGITGA